MTDSTDSVAPGAAAEPHRTFGWWDMWVSLGDLADRGRLRRRFVTEAPDLEIQGVGEGRRNPIPLREVLLHMIEEYARHNGHADVIRERIDGRVCQ
jgi:uncharacterized protein DUF664